MRAERPRARTNHGRRPPYHARRGTEHPRPLRSPFAAAAAEAAEAPAASGTEFAFQAEVKRLLDILINSLYNERDIFLRELISNASDALDKMRLLSLNTQEDVLGDDEETRKLEIIVSLDESNRQILRVRDRGVGMTKDELINNLGVIAKSGTSSFLERFSGEGAGGDDADMNLIGQFGVGFYSVFLVADYVEVSSKSNDSAEQYYWASRADGSFTVDVDTENEPLGRGTEIRIYLREDVADEYADEFRLEAIIKKYSQFISYPIILMKPEQYYEEPEEGASSALDDEDVDFDEEEEEEEEEEDGEEPPPPERKVRFVPQVMNEAKAVWLRSPSAVEDGEYATLFRALDANAPGAGAGAQPYLARTHFVGEGDVEFRSVLFIPLEADPRYYENYHSSIKSNIKFYIRRVFITDSFMAGDGEEYSGLLPKYLSFVIGVVDSDSLPLNVNREQLTQNRLLVTMKKKLARKVRATGSSAPAARVRQGRAPRPPASGLTGAAPARNRRDRCSTSSRGWRRTATRSATGAPPPRTRGRRTSRPASSRRTTSSGRPSACRSSTASSRTTRTASA